MNILFLTNNIDVTKPIYDWLCQTEGYGNVQLWEEPLSEESFRSIFSSIEFIISYNYNYIIENRIISIFSSRIINLHISLLPWNRGISPNLWSFIQDTPKGVTIHCVDEGIDTGDILVQRQLHFDENMETFATTYNKLHIAIQELFKENWGFIKNKNIIQKKQVSIHTRKQTEKLLNLYNISWNDNISYIKNKIKLKHENEKMGSF